MALSSSYPAQLEPGTITEVYRRLYLWCQQASEGMARVDYLSLLAKDRVMTQLRVSLSQEEIALLEVSLEESHDPRELMQSIIRRMNEFGSGVISFNGLGDQNSEALLQQLDLFREQITLSNIRQIWWMRPSQADYLINYLPDLNSWFILKLKLREIILVESTQEDTMRISTQWDPQEALQRSNQILARLQKAQTQGEPRYQLALLAKQAVDILERSGAILEARKRARALLPEVDVTEDLDYYDNSVKINALLAVADLYKLLGDEEKAKEMDQKLSSVDPQLLDTRQITKFKFNLPHVGIASFVGRGRALAVLDSLVEEDKGSMIIEIVGMGGVGKTELALQYAYRYQDQYGAILWIQARDGVMSQVIVVTLQAFPELRDRLQMLGTSEQQVEICWRQWQTIEGRVLVIFDDVIEVAEVLKAVPPVGDPFRVIFTSRQDSMDPRRFIKLRLGVLEEAAALDLLRSIAGEVIEENLPQAKILCERLGYLPLALELMGMFLMQELDLEKMLVDLQQCGLSSEVLTDIQETAQVLQQIKNPKLTEADLWSTRKNPPLAPPERGTRSS